MGQTKSKHNRPSFNDNGETEVAIARKIDEKTLESHTQSTYVHGGMTIHILRPKMNDAQKIYYAVKVPKGKIGGNTLQVSVPMPKGMYNLTIPQGLKENDVFQFAVDMTNTSSGQQQFKVVVPQDKKPGDIFSAVFNGVNESIKIPHGVKPGQEIFYWSSLQKHLNEAQQEQKHQQRRKQQRREQEEQQQRQDKEQKQREEHHKKQEDEQKQREEQQRREQKQQRQEQQRQEQQRQEQQRREQHRKHENNGVKIKVSKGKPILPFQGGGKYDFIINPKTGKRVSIYGVIGKKVLKHYVQLFKKNSKKKCKQK